MSRWAVLVLITLAHALGALAVPSVAPLSPFLLDAMQLSRAQVGLLLPAVYLGGVLMSLPAGWLVLNPSTGKAVVEWFPPRRRGRAMAIEQTGLTLDTGSYAWPCLGLACVGLAVAATLPWPAPLVERGSGR